MIFATIGAALDRLLIAKHETPVDLREEGAELAASLFESETDKFTLVETASRSRKWTHTDIPALEIERDSGLYGHHWTVHHDNVRLTVTRKLAKRFEAVLDEQVQRREFASIEALAAAIVARGGSQ